MAMGRLSELEILEFEVGHMMELLRTWASFRL
jgi:hypothetical protein